MTVLPIVERELRVSARRKGTYWNRAASAALAIVLFGLVFVLGGSRSGQAQGKQLFVALSVCFLGVSLLAGVAYTADSVSEEKREGTLGLLFLTDLKGYDVVLGKLVSSSVGAVYATLAMLPVLAIPLLLGGVSGGEFWRVVLVLVNTMFFSLAVGVMVSAGMRHGLAAMGVTLLVVLAANLAGPLLAVWIAFEANGNPPEVLLVPSVGYACAVAQEPLAQGRLDRFGASVGITHGLAWLCLALASRRVRQVWQEGGGGLAQRRWAQFRDWLWGKGERQQRWREATLDWNPAYWQWGRYWYKSWVVWVGLGVVGVFWLMGYGVWGRDWSQEEGVGLMTALGLHTLLRWWVAGEATLLLGPDRRSGALELLLCTDLSVREIVQGRMLGLRRQFLWPVAGVVAIDVWLLSVALGKAGGGDDSAWWLACYGCLVAVLVMDCVALAWLGAWCGLVFRHMNRALLLSGAVIFGLPWLLFLGLVVLLILFEVNHLPEPEWVFMLGAYAAISVGVSWFCWRWAAARVLHRLRAVVSGESQEPDRSSGGAKRAGAARR